MITIYRYERPGESFDRIPARDLTVDEFRAAIAGRSRAERKLIYALYTRTRVAEPAPVVQLEAPADPPAEPVTELAIVEHDGTEEDTDDGTTDRP
jgi:hypothetical protein